MIANILSLNHTDIFLIISILVLLIAAFFYLRLWKKKVLAYKSTKYKILCLESSAKLNQLNPHFIFNAIGPLQKYLISGENEKGLSYLHQLSDLLRMMLNMSRKNTIDLVGEIDFLNEFLIVHQVEKAYRFDFKIQSTINECEMQKINIPNLLIQPILENAIIHGMSDLKKEKGFIEISVEIENNFVVFQIIDNGDGFDVEQLKSKKDNAINIIQERLSLLTPKGSITFIKKENLFYSIIKIPIK